MKFLSENGYTTLTLDDALHQLVAGQASERSVVITFDDGYRDFYTEAYPVLRQFGFTATVFLVTGVTGTARQQFGGNECLTWNEVCELHVNGMNIGSHTVNHSDLLSLGAQELDYQVRRSKEVIEETIGAPVRSFSYPHAFPEADNDFTYRLARLLEEAGYDNGVSTILGTVGMRANRFFLPRLPINRWDDLQFFQAKLEGAYNWVHGPQYLVKSIKALSARSKIRPGATVARNAGKNGHG